MGIKNVTRKCQQVPRASASPEAPIAELELASLSSREPRSQLQPGFAANRADVPLNDLDAPDVLQVAGLTAAY